MPRIVGCGHVRGDGSDVSETEMRAGMPADQMKGMPADQMKGMPGD